MAPSKKCNPKPLSRIENTLGRGTHRSSRRTSGAAASSETENRQARAPRAVATVLNSNGGHVVERLLATGPTSISTPTSSSSARNGNTNGTGARSRSRAPPASSAVEQDRDHSPRVTRSVSRRRPAGGALLECEAQSSSANDQDRRRSPRVTRSVSRGRLNGRTLLEREAQSSSANGVHRHSPRSTRSVSRARSSGSAVLEQATRRPLNSSTNEVADEQSGLRHSNRRTTQAASRERSALRGRSASRGRGESRRRPATRATPVPDREARRVTFQEDTDRSHNLLASIPTSSAATPAGTQNVSSEARRGVATVPNTSSGRGEVSAEVRRSVTFADTNAGPSTSGSGNSTGTTPRSQAAKRRSQSAAPEPIARNGGGSTRYVPDDDDSQPSTSTAPPRNASRAVPKSGFVCCEEEEVTTFSSFIRFCEKGCKISIGDKYRTNGDKVYCPDCFNKKKAATPLNEANWKELKNENEAKEETLTCERCPAKWHRCCSLELQKKKFVCSSCTRMDEPLIRKTLVLYSKNEFEMFMEQELNTFLKNLYPQLAKNRLSVVSYKEEKEADIKKVVPPPLYSDFSNKYGKTIKYDVRTFYLFQRRRDNDVQGDVDVLVFAMSCHEYKNILGKSWVVIDYLDSVPYVVPGGAVFREAIIAYLAWAKKIGFNHAHFFSDPPQQGTDYILSIHPGDQRYKTAEQLLGFYVALLEKGVEREILVEFRTLKQELARRPYAQPSDLLPFNEGLWMNCLREFDEEITEKYGSKLPADDYSKKISSLIKRKFKVNAKNNFFIDLNLTADKVNDKEDPLKQHSVLGDRDKFFEKCRKENWEFSSLRRAKYTSVAVIEMMVGAPDQRKNKREMGLML